MASIIRIKRSSVAGNPTTLAAGELAYSALVDNGSNGGDRLYIGMGTETNGNAANHVVIGGKYFTDMITAATDANTASTLVKRDASGNFSAGTITAALSGNASTATALATGRTISLTGDVTYTSSSFDGTGNVTGTATLANSGVTAGSYGSSTAVPVITVDAKGRVTSVTTSSISTTLNIAGGTGTDAVTLGTDTLTFAGGTGVTTTVTNNQVSFAIGQAVGTTSDVTFNNMVLSGYLRGPSTFTIDPAAYGDDTGTVVIAGNLTVQGTTTTINSTAVEIADKNIILSKNATTDAEANNSGITVKGATDKKFEWNVGSWYLTGGGLNIESGKTLFLNNRTAGLAGGSNIYGPSVQMGFNVYFPDQGGTIAMTSDIANAGLTLQVSGAASSGTAIGIGTGTGFTANASSASTYSITTGPALSALATTMSGATTGFLKKTAADTYTLDTNSYATGTVTTTSVFVGGNAGGTNKTTTYNVAVGYNALENENSGSTIGIGADAGRGVVYVDNNGDWGGGVFIGTSAGYNGARTVGSTNNVAIGYSTYASNGAGAAATGYENVAIGAFAQASITSGHHNVTVGGRNPNDYEGVGALITTGNYNTIVGAGAATTLTTGSNNTVVGYGAATSTATVSNEVTIGNSSVTSFRIPGLGITWTNSVKPITGNQTITLSGDVSGSGTTAITVSITTVDGGTY